jgi:hypothetical protein
MDDDVAPPPDEDHDDDATDGGAPPPDALSRLVAQLAEEKIIQPSLADFLR